MKLRKHSLFANTIMLYILTFSNYFFNFITIPYQTRMLGPELYGNLGVATSLMTYFQLILDFGFLLSATQEVAQNQSDKKVLSGILEKVLVCKVFLIALSGLIMVFLCIKVERFHTDWPLFALYFISTIIYSLLPDFLYRGLEDMRTITIRSVLIKLFFTIMIFILLKDKSQYYIIPILNILGNLGAVLGVYYHVYKKIGLRPVRIKMIEVIKSFKESSLFFYSRIASTIYSTTNTFVLGFLYGNSAAVVGYYSSADKLIVTGKQAITPITDSLYPYMVKNKDFKLVKKMLIVLMPIITIGCVVVAIFGELICTILFGKDFAFAGEYLRLLTPTIWCAFPAMMFGFPVLSPLGLAKWANISNIFGAALQISMLLILFFSSKLDAVSICFATCITELAILIFRVSCVLFFKKRLKR